MATDEKEDPSMGATIEVAPPELTDDCNVVRMDDVVLKKMASSIDNIGEITQDAFVATEFEKNMSFGQGILLYPKATMFSFIISMSLIMEGFDTGLLGGFFGYPSFQERFGQPVGDGTYQLTASWQSGLQAGVQVGEIIGLWIAGVLAERYGYRKTLIGALIMMIGVIFMMFFAQNIGMLFAGEILCGLPWGAFQTLTTTYAADIAPPVLRPMLTTWNNACWVIGQTISTGVLRGLLSRTDQWGWRIPYAVQWAWPVPIIIGVIFAPESPWWLVRHDQVDEARKALISLVSKKNTEYNVDHNIALIVHTNAHEKAVSDGTSYKECFKGSDLRRTEIACVVWIIQVTCGTWFGGNVTYFMEQAGLEPGPAFDLGIGHNLIGLAGTIAAWWILNYIGRRALYLWGLAVMFLILIIVGFMGIPESTNPIAYATGAIMFIFTFTYGITVGPVCYCLVAEMPSTRLRIKTVALARNCFNIASIAANFLNNPILNPTAWNLRGKGGFVWCGFTLLSWVWTYYRLPETKGLSAGTLDVLFEQKVPARKFHSVDVDEFRAAHLKVGYSTDALVNLGKVEVR